METSRADIAIVGGGASGALVAAHLVRGASPPLHILVIERAGKVGEGIAYSTSSTCHLLNVPARSMSAFEDDPEHFVRWLASKGQPGAEESFAPRALYGRYLRDTLWAQGQIRTPSPTVETVYAGVVDLEVGPHGPQLVLDNGHTVATRAVVLATGVVM